MNKTALLLTACAGMANMAAAQTQKPNIVIIYTDDMGIGDLSCYNSGWVMTHYALKGVTLSPLLDISSAKFAFPSRYDERYVSHRMGD